jgi:hypothetical protein
MSPAHETSGPGAWPWRAPQPPPRQFGRSPPSPASTCIWTQAMPPSTWAQSPRPPSPWWRAGRPGGRGHHRSRRARRLPRRPSRHQDNHEHQGGAGMHAPGCGRVLTPALASTAQATSGRTSIPREHPHDGQRRRHPPGRRPRSRHAEYRLHGEMVQTNEPCWQRFVMAITARDGTIVRSPDYTKPSHRRPAAGKPARTAALRTGRHTSPVEPCSFRCMDRRARTRVTSRTQSGSLAPGFPSSWPPMP